MRVSYLPLIVLGSLAGCQGAPVVEAPASASASSWKSEVVLEGKSALGGCAVGMGGVVAVGADRFVYLARWGQTWQVDPIAQTPGEMIQVAVGDLLPDRPGDEILAVGIKTGGEDDGGPGAAVLIYKDGGEWAQELIFEDSALLHAVCIVDGAAFVAGYGKRAYRLRYVKGAPPRSDAAGFRPSREGGWVSEELAELPGAGRSAVATRGGVAFACKDGSIALLRQGGEGWSSEIVDSRDGGRARIGALGGHMVVSDDSGVLSLLPGADSAEELPAGLEQGEIYRSKDKLRGAVLADLDPASPGLEAATAGYTGEIVLLRQVNGAFAPEVLATVEGSFHHLASGKLTPPPGYGAYPSRHLCLAGVTLTGQLIVVYREFATE